MSFLVQILGANSATPVYGRHPSSQVVSVGNENFLIDCGEGTQMQMQKYRVKTSKIDHIFISHLHGDHFFGLMGFLNTLQLNGRKKALNLYAPPGLDEIITIHLKHSRSSLDFKINFIPLEEKKQSTIFENNHLWIDCFPVFHNISCYGFLIKEKPKSRKINKDVLPEGLQHDQFIKLKAGEDLYDEEGNLLYKNQSLTLPPKKSRSYAYCTDTQYEEALSEIFYGVDLLYHEATFMNEHASRARETGHATTREAAFMAKKAKVQQLIIGHYSSRYRNLEPMLEEARQIFPDTDMACDGKIFNISE